MPDDRPLPGDALQLLDLQLPDPVSWWPPAPLWWLLMLLALAALSIPFLIRRSKNRRPQRRYRQAALAELDYHYGRYRQNPEPAAFVQALSGLLKRVALQTDDAERVAFLSGTQWGDYLGQGQSAEQRALIRQALGQAHHPNPELDAAAVYRFARRWIDSREAL